MKSLPTYINEKLIIKQKQKITPTDGQELIDAILDHFNNEDGNLNNIDVSKLKKEDFYGLFFNLRNEIKKNNITEINISNWKLKELYWDPQSRRSMFEWCDTLKTVILPNCLETIDEYMFYNCNNLYNIIIPDSVISIYDNAFYGCRELKSLIIPNSVTSIERDAFIGCPNLTITVPNERVKKLVLYSMFGGEIIINK